MWLVVCRPGGGGGTASRYMVVILSRRTAVDIKVVPRSGRLMHRVHFRSLAQVSMACAFSLVIWANGGETTSWRPMSAWRHVWKHAQAGWRGDWGEAGVVATESSVAVGVNAGAKM